MHDAGRQLLWGKFFWFEYSDIEIGFFWHRVDVSNKSWTFPTKVWPFWQLLDFSDLSRTPSCCWPAVRRRWRSLLSLLAGLAPPPLVFFLGGGWHHPALPWSTAVIYREVYCYAGQVETLGRELCLHCSHSKSLLSRHLSPATPVISRSGLEVTLLSCTTNKNIPHCLSIFLFLPMVWIGEGTLFTIYPFFG